MIIVWCVLGISISISEMALRMLRIGLNFSDAFTDSCYHETKVGPWKRAKLRRHHMKFMEI